jgi:apolipoprotein N-acyltransferase
LLTADDGTQAMWRESEDTLARLLAHGETDVFVGMVELEAEKTKQGLRQRDEPRAWNSLVHVQPDFSLQTARKRHLVMFGEYIPWLDAMPWLRRIYEQQAGVAYSGAFAAGTSIEPLRLSVDGHAVSVIPSICFEDTVAEETRCFYRDEAQVIVNLTNDGWFRTSAAAAQHFANASFRCIELRRPMLRCANSGVSAAISILGNTQTLRDATGSTFVRGHSTMVLPVPLHSTWSLYAQWGDGPLLVLAMLGLCHGRRRNATAGQSA